MSDIINIQDQIKSAEELIERRKMAMKLSENREFRKLFNEGYFVTEAARLVQLSDDPNLDIQERADALAMAKATGHCKRYMSMTIQMGYHAENDLPQMKATLEELRAEEE